MSFYFLIISWGLKISTSFCFKEHLHYIFLIMHVSVIYIYIYFWFFVNVFYFILLSEERLNTNLKTELQYSRGEQREAKSMRNNKETLKKQIGALCVVAACSQIIKHRVSNTRKKKFWVKPWLAEKHKSLYHELVSEPLLHDKEEFRMFLRMSTETYKVSMFVMMSN